MGASTRKLNAFKPLDITNIIVEQQPPKQRESRLTTVWQIRIIRTPSN